QHYYSLHHRRFPQLLAARYHACAARVARGFRRERLRPEDMRGVRPGPRRELLRAASKNFRGIQVSIRVGCELMDRPEKAGGRAVRSPGIQQLSVQVILEQFVERPGEGPQKVVGAYPNRV